MTRRGVAFWLGMVSVLLAGEVGGPGWGVAAGTAWAVQWAVLLLWPVRWPVGEVRPPLPGIPSGLSAGDGSSTLGDVGRSPVPDRGLPR